MAKSDPLSTRVTISESPYPVDPAVDEDFFSWGLWPCNWVHHPTAGEPPHALAFRRRFTMDKAATVRVHVSADERYELYLDGELLGRGPERGAPLSWYYETYDLSLKPGDHVLVARVWVLGDVFAPFAQLTLKPGFLLSAADETIALLGTGVALWETKVLDGYKFLDPSVAFGSGAKVVIDAAAFSWGFEKGRGEGWQPVDVGRPGSEGDAGRAPELTHFLRPAPLPPMLCEERRVGKVRHVSAPASAATANIVVVESENLPDEIAGWQGLFESGAVTIPPNTLRRVIVDFENYYCFYPEVTVSGGAGASVRIGWAESLLKPSVPDDCPDWMIGPRPKPNRNEIYGHYFHDHGMADTFKPDGAPGRKFDTPWWRPGRYIEIVVQTAGEALTIDDLRLVETRYPLEMDTTFEASDKRFETITPIALRGDQMCTHETHFDCPFFEQQMNPSDTRQGMLGMYTIAGDDRMARKALQLFNVSRLPTGLTRPIYPNRISVKCPSFTMLWVSLIHDFALWRDDPAFVRSLMPGVRTTIDALCDIYVGDDGLFTSPGEFNWIDWVPGWWQAIPPAARRGVSAMHNWQLVWTLRQTAALETYANEPLLAQRLIEKADALAARTVETFWHEDRGMFSDDVDGKDWLEHTQIWAILSGALEPAMRDRTADALFEERCDIEPTIYFVHYFFEVCALLGRMDVFMDRMKIWFDMEGMGLKAPYEMPGCTRSDCHGYGGSFLYHCTASILGIRPAEAGYRTVTVRPQLGPLEYARGESFHPLGKIAVDMKRTGDRLTGSVTLPAGLAGTFIDGDRSIPIREGRQEI